MQRFCEKLGRIGIITENDHSNYSARIYLLELLNSSLNSNWDIEFLILNNGGNLSPRIQNGFCVVFESSTGEQNQFATPSSLIQSGLNVGDEIQRAMPLYQHLMRQHYDAFIFLGLSPATCSLLPVTHKRNCVVPLLAPCDWHYFINNQALKTALLSCDYFLCHSAREAAIISSLQPHAEIKHFPLMVDLELLAERPVERRIAFDEEFVLMIAEAQSPTLLEFAARLRRAGHKVVLTVDRSMDDCIGEEIPIVDMISAISQFREWIPKIRGSCLFFGRQFFPIIYNLCQYNIPLYLAPNYPWHDLIDGNSVGFLSFERDPDLDHPCESRSAIPYGYHHYRYFVNYWIRFLQEWCINNKLRCERGAWKFPTPTPAKRTSRELIAPMGK